MDDKLKLDRWFEVESALNLGAAKNVPWANRGANAVKDAVFELKRILDDGPLPSRVDLAEEAFSDATGRFAFSANAASLPEGSWVTRRLGFSRHARTLFEIYINESGSGAQLRLVLRTNRQRTRWTVESAEWIIG